MKTSFGMFGLSCLLVLFGTPVTSPAGTPVLIDFESLPDGTPVTPGMILSNQFASLGLTFGFTSGGSVLLSDAVPTRSGRYCIGAAAGPNAQFNYQLTLRFNPPAKRFGLAFIDDSFPVRIWGTTNSSVVGPGFDVTTLEGPAGGIESVTLEGGHWKFSSDWWGIDDLTFELMDPPAPPRLRIESANVGYLRMSWSVYGPPLVLEQTAQVGSGASWTSVTNSVSVAGFSYVVTVDAGNGSRFFRLRQN